MEILKKFLKCYFPQTFDFDDLDRIIQDFRGHPSEIQLITELHQIIQTKSYALAARIVDQYGDRTWDLETTEKVIRFMYDRLIGRPVTLDLVNSVNNYKIVFCPVCCADPVDIGSMIEKATIIGKAMQLYICKPCKLVWLTEDIRADNAQDYKKFMKTLGLKGLWKELSDVDTL